VTGGVRAGLEAAFGELSAVHDVAGGCISPSYRVELSDGRHLFVKTAGKQWPADAFAEEARSLERLRRTNALVVPRVHGAGADWLALEWLEPAPASEQHWRALGRGLAQVHLTTGSAYGWDAANYIGPLPQSNASTTSWPEFWREQRLLPQLERARPRLDRRTVHDIERLLGVLDERLGPAGADGASLLHGDLWNGNVHMSTAGAGVIDPASYYGHRETDLAMAALFGGFPRSFHESYEAEWPLLPGATARRPIYQLYYLLVHVTLFGGSYAASTAAAVRDALG
jgi:protein-ribulosamine 3-kinase